MNGEIWRVLCFRIIARSRVLRSGYRIWRERLRSSRRDHVVSRHRQERGEGPRLDQLAEEPSRFLVTAVPGWRAQLCELLVEDPAGQRLVDGAAVVELGAVAGPLPDLRAADLGGGGILHQIVERHAAGAAQPSLDIADPDIDVLPEPRLGDRAVGDREKIRCGDVHVLALAGDLVGLRHLAVEDLFGDRDEPGMCDPGAVVAVAGLALLV